MSKEKKIKVKNLKKWTIRDQYKEMEKTFERQFSYINKFKKKNNKFTPLDMLHLQNQRNVLIKQKHTLIV